jgi:hypothetical protein
MWWGAAHGRRFAVVVEEDMMDHQWWVLWVHLNGRWEHQLLFYVQDDNHNDEWEPQYGVVQNTAVVYDGWDLYLILEHQENVGQLVWLIYYLGEREPGSGLEALLLMELWVPEVADWEVHNI